MFGTECVYSDGWGCRTMLHACPCPTIVISTSYLESCVYAYAASVALADISKIEKGRVG